MNVNLELTPAGEKIATEKLSLILGTEAALALVKDSYLSFTMNDTYYEVQVVIARRNMTQAHGTNWTITSIDVVAIILSTKKLLSVPEAQG